MFNIKLFVVITLFSIWILTSCLIEENINLPYESYLPDQLNDNWEISNPATEGLNQDIIDDIYHNIYDDDLYPNLHGLLIARNGKLIAEAYTKDKGERNIPHNIVSATKSITSILTGIAIYSGYIESINATVYQIIPQYFDNDIRKREITIHHVLTMETGLNFNNDIHTNEMFNYSGSSLEFVLHKKLVFLPGTSWYYGDGNPQIISGIIQEVTGKTEEEFAKENLFDPLSITKYRWEKHSDGLTYGAKGLWLLPRDMAKIGQLMVQQGEWNGEQIVPSDWITESTMVQTTHQHYGYYWYPPSNYNSYYAEGHGGQLIWIAPEEQLVIVFTSDSYAKSYMLSANYSTIINDIINSIAD